nr:MAG TPA: hypothetical protein [Caudoviricetes sp.]
MNVHKDILSIKKYGKVETIEFNQNSEIFKIYDNLEDVCIDLSGSLCASWLSNIEFDLYKWYLAYKKDKKHTWIFDEYMEDKNDNEKMYQIVETAISNNIFITWVKDKNINNICPVTFKSFLRLYNDWKNTK